MTTSTYSLTREVHFGAMGTIRSFVRLMIVQFKLFLREPVALFFNVFFPVLMLLLFGLIWGNEPGTSMLSAQYGYIDAQVPALAALVIGTVAFMTIPVATATAREQKLLRRFQATPMRPVVYLAADVAVYFTIALLAMLALLIVARFVFDLRFGGNWLAVVAAFTFCTFAFIAMGYVIASLAPTSRMAQVTGQLIFFPMLFLSGASMPLVLMPRNVQQIAEWLPLTHVVRLLQDLWFGTGWNGTAVWVLLAMLVAGTAISARVFRWE